MRTFRYPPAAVADLGRSLRVGAWLGCAVLLMFGVAFSFAMYDALQDRLGELARVPPIVAGIVLAGGLLYYDRKKRAELAELATTSLTLSDRRLTQLDAARRVLAEIDLDAPYRCHDGKEFVPILIVEQGSRSLRFAREIEHVRDICFLLLRPTYQDSLSPRENVAKGRMTGTAEEPLVFRNRAATAALQAGDIRKERAGCTLFLLIGGVVSGLIALQLSLWIALIFFGIAIAGSVSIWRLTSHVLRTELVDFEDHLTYDADGTLRQRGRDGTELAAIDLKQPFECYYHSRWFHVTQGERLVKFHKDINGADDLVTWFLLRNYDSLTDTG